MQALAALCAGLPHGHIVDAGCGEGSYDRYLQDALPDARIVGFDLSKKRCGWRPERCRRPPSAWAAASVPRCGTAGRIFC